MINTLILGIETSCDETGIGIVRGTELLADTLASSVEEQARFGGVVPEVASRAHVEAMIRQQGRHRHTPHAGGLARAMANHWVLFIRSSPPTSP